MTQNDMVLLIQAMDELEKLDEVLERLTGSKLSNGEFSQIDRVYDVIKNNSHPCYSENEEELEVFFHIVKNRQIMPQQRAEILLNGTVRYAGEKG